MDIFFIFSALYLLVIFSLSAIVFLWILGANKARRDAQLSSHSALNRTSANPFDTHTSPSQSQIIPRRLSFSAATPSDFQARPHTPRRVTFSLTPEQQRAERAKSVHPLPSSNARPRTENPPLLELFDDHRNPPTPRVDISISPALQVPREAATHKHEAQAAPPELGHLMTMVEEEKDDRLRAHRETQEKITSVGGQATVSEEHRPFGFPSTAAAYPFGLNAARQGGGGVAAYGGEVGNVRKRRALRG